MLSADETEGLELLLAKFSEIMKDNASYYSEPMLFYHEPNTVNHIKNHVLIKEHYEIFEICHLGGKKDILLTEFFSFKFKYTAKICIKVLQYYLL